MRSFRRNLFPCPARGNEKEEPIMKRILALALSLVMALTLCVPALAAAPQRPGWVKDWEYTVFETDDAYTGET